MPTSQIIRELKQKAREVSSEGRLVLLLSEELAAKQDIKPITCFGCFGGYAEIYRDEKVRGFFSAFGSHLASKNFKFYFNGRDITPRLLKRVSANFPFYA